MRLGIAQIGTRPGDLTGTAKRILAQASAAAVQGVELLVFPVPVLAGPALAPYGIHDRFIGNVSHMLAELAPQVACPCLVPVSVGTDDGMLHRVVLLEGGMASVVEPQPASAQAPSFSLGDTSLSVAFSFEQVMACADAARHTDVVVYLPDYGFAFDDNASALGASVDDGRAAIAASMTHAWLVGVNAVGAYDMQVFSGSSYVVAPNGTTVAVAPAFEEALLVANVGADAVVSAPIPPVPYDPRYHLWQALVVGTRDYMHALGSADAALLLDGTVISAVLATVATDALGPTHVHVLVSAPQDKRDGAVALAHRLRVRVHKPGRPLDASNDAGYDHAQLELAALMREVGATPLSPLDKTAVALCGMPSRVEVAALAPLGDVWRSDLLDSAHMRNAISPVFPSLAVTAADVPTLDGLPTAVAPELLLCAIDNVLAQCVEGSRLRPLRGLREATRAQVKKAVIAALGVRGQVRALAVPCLTMSVCPLSEARAPLGFAWEDAIRERRVDGGDELGLIQDERPIAVPAAPVAADGDTHRHDDGDLLRELSDPSVYGMLRETFDLLRDLSGNDEPDASSGWHNPFSEN